ncbi:hypothetical protein A0256_13630 [Mucilaginibacter sp. PAMC 26640]|nr:hypothetical protein A0256_13630 [Mucilaginibacter sp. PAMC 26640]
MKLPAQIAGEIKKLTVFTASQNVEKLRERQAKPNGVSVDIYFHSAGKDLYFCDVRKRYLSWKEVTLEADSKISCGQYLFTAVIERKSGVYFTSSRTASDDQFISMLYPQST